MSSCLLLLYLKYRPKIFLSTFFLIFYIDLNPLKVMHHLFDFKLTLIVIKYLIFK
jgi:hypothetical protein